MKEAVAVASEGSAAAETEGADSSRKNEEKCRANNWERCRGRLGEGGQVGNEIEKFNQTTLSAKITVKRPRILRKGRERQT